MIIIVIIIIIDNINNNNFHLNVFPLSKKSLCNSQEKWLKKILLKNIWF